MQPLAEQILAFLLITFLGMVLGFSYDCYRTIRQIWQPKVWGTILGDAVFWIINTIGAYLGLLYFTWGEVRLYVFLALICGLVIYFRFASRPSRFLLLKVYLLTVRVFTAIIKFILLPLRLIWKVILLPWRFLALLIVLVLRGLRQIKGLIWHRPPPPDQKC